MRIPEIREELNSLADHYGIARLRELAGELTRRSPGSRAPVKSRPMTPALRDAIRAYKRANPDAPQQKIADVFNVNPGRVSEALRGFRK
jgi:hypothetical protein